MLLEEFHGAGLVKAHLPARLDVLQTLGLLTPERREALCLAPFVMATEAIGLRDDLALGLGPAPLTAPFRQAEGLGPDVVVVSGRADTTAAEVRAAVAKAAALSLPTPAS